MHGDLASPLCFQTFRETPHACGHHRKLAITIVHDVLRKGCPHIHKVRLESLCDVVRAALSASSHTLSNLARALDTKRTRAAGALTAVRRARRLFVLKRSIVNSCSNFTTAEHCV